MELHPGQPQLAGCSGALIAPDVVVTAGHCLDKSLGGNRCSELALVFGFWRDKSAKASTSFAPNDVYYCRKAVHAARLSDDNDQDEDWGLILLDRPVQGRKPLAVDSAGRIASGMRVFAIGYPWGIPAKITGAAPVSNAGKSVFEANLDVFKGNSGSPVFNADTLEIEGVAVSESYNDFTLQSDGKAGVSVRGANDPKGAGVERVSVILPHLRELRDSGRAQTVARKALSSGLHGSQAFGALSEIAASRTLFR